MAITLVLSYSAAIILYMRKSNRRNYSIIFISVVAAVLLLTYSLAIDFTNLRLSEAQRYSNKIETNDGSLDVYLFKAGEKGLLVYDWRDSKFLFLKWENIKQIDFIGPTSVRADMMSFLGYETKKDR